MKTQICVNTKERLDHIDFFRGIGIILMIMGHIGFGGYFDHYIHSFHMPMFFFISGLFYKPSDKESLKSVIIKKAKTLLIPYVFLQLYTIFCILSKLEKLNSLN